MRLPESTAFHAYIDPARTRSAWWRVLVGLLVICGVWFGGGLWFIGLISQGVFAPLGLGPDAVHGVTNTGRTMTPQGVMVFLLTFLGLWIGVAIAVRGVHWRPFGTVFHPSRRPDGANLIRGAVFAVAFYAISIVAYLAVLGMPERSALPMSEWSVWIVPISLGIVMQATSEEVLFRGYLLQQFAAWSRHPLVWAVVPAMIFAALHYDPQMEAGMRSRMLIQILIIGLITAALVWRTGGLGAAMGLHVANNILAIGGAGIEGSALGFELWLFPPETMDRMFPFDLAMGFLMLGAVFVLFAPERRI